MPTTKTAATELLLTIIAAADGRVGFYTLVGAVGLRHGRAFVREYGDALDALVAAGTVRESPSMFSLEYEIRAC